MRTSAPTASTSAFGLRTVTRSLALAALLLVGLAAGVLTAPPAGADEDAVGRISRMDITADLAAEGGEARVVLNLELDLGSEEAHGPYLVLAELQEIVGDPNHYRRLDVRDISASSETAPDDLRVEREDGAVQVYIGDEDTEITGAHTYRVEYTITGLINPDVDGTDELYWNVIAPGGFEIPIDDVTVAVTGPATPTAGACYVGSTGSDRECASLTTTGDTVEAAQPQLDDGEGLSLVVGWPAGTFTGAEPELVHRYTASNVLQLTPLTGSVTGLALVAGIGAVVLGARIRGRDRAYLGLTPGLAPRPGEEARTGPASRGPATVRFTPPDGVRPGEVGTLADEVAHRHDVTATIVDLAVRGYLRVEEVADSEEAADEGDQDTDADTSTDTDTAAGTGTGTDDGEATEWRLVRLRTDTDGLEPYEAALLDRLFAEHDAPTLSDLGEDLSTTLTSATADLYRTVTERGWFRAAPQKVRTRWVLRGLAILALGLVAVPVLWLTQTPVVLAVAPVGVGIAVMIGSAAMPARTAAGTAVLAQALGFREYLATAEAEQIRFEEGADVFSRYLPWAIVFGLADRWAQIVSDAAAQGRPVPEPGWYVGLHGAALWSGGDRFSSSVGAFTAAATTASTGAGGSSGFSGSVGGGVGGMGGGTW
ncbi:hypothetical protein GCM10023169_41660 [Georgenia halophila]|uniref:DUF2207 domain-containing protein n=1 Tax=Georgenia halophila TaxID=620889 RepID=A0ABP8LQK9_9MICO